MVGTGANNDMLLDKSVLQEVGLLRAISIPEFFPSLKVARIAGFESNEFIAVNLHPAVAHAISKAAAKFTYALGLV